MIEALYLLEKKLIQVAAGEKLVAPSDLRERAKGLVERFDELYMVYKDLRDRGFILRRGLKFGCDYLVYRMGPGLDHAPYGVQVYSAGEKIDPIDFVRMGRLLHSVRKKLIIALVDKNGVKYVLNNWWKP